MPKLSIITPCYNAASHIESNIRSVNEQSFTDWERIFVDDGSTDNTAELISELIKGDARQRLIRKPNGGVSSARNAGFPEADQNAQYLAFLDADDLVHPDYYNSLVGYLEKTPEAAVVFSKIRMMDETSQKGQVWEFDRYVPTRFWIRKLKDSEYPTPFHCIFLWMFCTEGVPVLRREIFERAGRWDENLFYGEGIDLYANIASFARIDKLPVPLYYYRVHENQATRNINHEKDVQFFNDKWEKRAAADKKISKLVNEARHFKTYRLTALQLYSESKIAFKKGNIAKSFTLLLSFIKRYAGSFKGYEKH